MRKLLGVWAVTAALLGCSAPALAIINGQPADPDRFPYFAIVDGCGGALIAPDRVLTAGHCIDDLVEGQPIWFGAGPVRRNIVRVAANPRWQKLIRAGASIGSYDTGIVQLDAPVTTITPLRLATPADAALWAPGAAVTIVGQGSDTFEDTGFGPVRTAQLETASDGDCKQRLRKIDEESASEYKSATMLCTIDPDRKSPYTSPCYGDSGSPLTATASDGAAVLVGVDNWGIACGALGGDPEMFAEVPQISAFAQAAAPVWRPLALDRPELTGTTRVGRTVHCTMPRYADPQPGRVTRKFLVVDSSGEGSVIAHGGSLKISSSLRQENLSCSATATNAGGESTAYAYRVSKVR